MMRNPAQPQSALRAPLNTILGTESNIRVLRVLSALDHPLSPTELARRTSLQPSGMRRTLQELVNTGIVEWIGVGARQQVQLRSNHPLAGVIRMLFRAEADRVGAIIDGIVKSIRQCDPAPHAVWIEGPVATQTDQLNDPLTVGVLADTQTIGALVESLQEAVTIVERTQDITIDIHGWTIPDLQAILGHDETQLSTVRSLLGPLPSTFLQVRRAQVTGRRRAITHADLDAQARALGIAIGNKLAKDPTLIARTKAHLLELLKTAAPYEQRELREWGRILDTTSIPRLRHLLADPGERGTRLRQSMPFLNVLTEEERDRAIAGVER